MAGLIDPEPNPWVESMRMCGCCGTRRLHARNAAEGFRRAAYVYICEFCDLGTAPGSFDLWRWVTGERPGPPAGFGRGII